MLEFWDIKQTFQQDKSITIKVVMNKKKQKIFLLESIKVFHEINRKWKSLVIKSTFYIEAFKCGL